VSRKYPLEGRYQVTSHIAVILLVLILFVSVSYFFFLAKPDEQVRRLELMAEFETHAALWNRERPARFQYSVDRSCDCPDEDGRPYRVREIDGQREAAFPIPVEASTGALLDAPPRPLWIDDIFGIIERALRSGAIIEVRYDRALGYPRSAIIGPDEQYEITDFERVNLP